MKQLLIVNSAKALKTGVADDLTVLDEGQIGFFHLSPDASGANEGKVTFFNTKPTDNFGIALGRGANVPAFVIPEVDINTLNVKAGSVAAENITGTTISGKNISGCNFYQRNGNTFLNIG